MANSKPGLRQLAYVEYLERENRIQHHTNNEDMEQYALMAVGDIRCADIHRRILESHKTGLLSKEPVQNQRYLFVSAAALSSRACIGAGMADIRAYQISDMFIRRMDELVTAQEIVDLSCDMMVFYAREMQALAKRSVYSKPVAQCIDHIYTHLHEKISIDDLAKLVDLNRSYLTKVFKRETGRTIHEYVLDMKIHTAQNMLNYSDYTLAEIAAVLMFGSQSYFTRVFKEQTGVTPWQYRNAGYERNIEMKVFEIK